MIVVNARFLTQKITGVQRYAIEISRILRRLDKSIVFVSPANIIDKQLAFELGAVVVGKNSGSAWEQIDLRYFLLTNGRPLLVNFCNSGVISYKKQVVTIHDMSYKVNPRWFSRKFYLWYNFLIPHIAYNSRKILTVSNSSKNDIVKYLKVDADKISVIYNSSHLDAVNAVKQEGGDKYLLTVSSFDPRKNLDNLIAAFKQLNTDVKLLIVGPKSDNFGVAFNEALLNSSIILKGYIGDDELVNLMYNAEAFIYVSLYEGFGLPPLEAMGLGCPVVVSDIAAHREVCGYAALYADPDNVNDIADKISAVLNNHQLRKELITAGKKNIKRFDWLTSAKEVLKIINELV